jgi:hypothetical protein
MPRNRNKPRCTQSPPQVINDQQQKSLIPQAPPIPPWLATTTDKPSTIFSPNTSVDVQPTNAGLEATQSTFSGQQTEPTPQESYESESEDEEEWLNGFMNRRDTYKAIKGCHSRFKSLLTRKDNEIASLNTRIQDMENTMAAVVETINLHAISLQQLETTTPPFSARKISISTTPNIDTKLSNPPQQEPTMPTITPDQGTDIPQHELKLTATSPQPPRHKSALSASFYYSPTDKRNNLLAGKSNLTPAVPGIPLEQNTCQNTISRKKLTSLYQSNQRWKRIVVHNVPLYYNNNADSKDLLANRIMIRYRMALMEIPRFLRRPNQQDKKTHGSVLLSFHPETCMDQFALGIYINGSYRRTSPYIAPTKKLPTASNWTSLPQQTFSEVQFEMFKRIEQMRRPSQYPPPTSKGEQEI